MRSVCGGRHLAATPRLLHGPVASVPHDEMLTMRCAATMPYCSDLVVPTDKAHLMYREVINARNFSATPVTNTVGIGVGGAGGGGVNVMATATTTSVENSTQSL